MISAFTSAPTLSLSIANEVRIPIFDAQYVCVVSLAKMILLNFLQLIANPHYSCSIVSMSYVSVRVDRVSKIAAAATIDDRAAVVHL